MRRFFFSVHPGGVASKNDGQYHFIPAAAIIRNYGVHSSICHIVDSENPMPIDPSHLIELRPDPTGTYKIPNPSEKFMNDIFDRLPPHGEGYNSKVIVFLEAFSLLSYPRSNSHNLASAIFFLRAFHSPFLRKEMNLDWYHVIHGAYGGPAANRFFFFTDTFAIRPTLRDVVIIEKSRTQTRMSFDEFIPWLLSMRTHE